jgi:hypothetical protein
MVRSSWKYGFLLVMSSGLMSCRGHPTLDVASMIAAEQCLYTSRTLVYPLGNAVASTSERRGAWLALTSELVEAGAVAHVASSWDIVGNRQEGAWWQDGDSLRVSLHDLFTSNTLRLHRTGASFRGRGNGTTDNGNHPVDRWHAEFAIVPCPPRPPRGASDAATESQRAGRPNDR